MTRPPRARATAALLAIAAVAGAGTMTVELAAVRLLAPWFGASLIVWTNVIAVVLLALALGYLVGGRISERGRPLRSLGRLLAAAAVLTALLPLLAGRVAAWFLPTGLSLHEAAPLVLWGSLASSLLLFLPPAALLGTVSPLLVEVLQESRGGGAGRAGGTVLCASTFGSLVGVFATSLFLLQSLGLGGTFTTGGLALAAAAVGAFLLDGTSGARAGALAVALAGAGVPGAWLGPGRPEPEEGVRLLARAESAYQSIRVVEDGRFDPPERFLQVNEGFDSYQSVWQPEPGLLSTGYYYNDFVLPAAWDGREAGPYRVLVLGLGGGTVFRVLDGALPEALELELSGVDVDGVVLELGRRFMDLGRVRGDAPRVHVADARWALRFLDGEQDLIVLDSYANQIEIPPHLCTREYFEEVRAHLAPGGWLAANLGGFRFEDPVVEAVSTTCAAAFEAEVLLLRVPRARNYTLFARKDGPVVDDEGELLPVSPAFAPLLGPRELPGFVRVVPPPPADGTGQAPVLTDDTNPIEWLQLRSVLEGELLPGEEAG